MNEKMKELVQSISIVLHANVSKNLWLWMLIGLLRRDATMAVSPHQYFETAKKT
jgi:hypothetical protein